MTHSQGDVYGLNGYQVKVGSEIFRSEWASAKGLMPVGIRFRSVPRAECLSRTCGHTGSTQRNWEKNGVWTIPKAASTQLPGDEQMGGTSKFSLCHP